MITASIELKAKLMGDYVLLMAGEQPVARIHEDECLPEYRHNGIRDALYCDKDVTVEIRLSVDEE